jgi:hypothetical protein
MMAQANRQNDITPKPSTLNPDNNNRGCQHLKLSAHRQRSTKLRAKTTLLSLFAAMGLAVFGSTVAAQDHSYTSSKVGYIVEFPSPMWRLVDEPDEAHQHAEFIYGDRNDGYLRIRKEALEEGLTVREFARRDQEQKVRFLPAYVDGKEDPFTGRMSGVTISYEYTQAGKPMAGRTYYLQADDRTVYALRFTGMRDKLSRIRNQTDQIARAFKLK